MQGLRRDQKSMGAKLCHEYMNLPQHRGLIKAQNRGVTKWIQGKFIAQLNELGILKGLKNIVNKCQKDIISLEAPLCATIYHSISIIEHLIGIKSNENMLEKKQNYKHGPVQKKNSR